MFEIRLVEPLHTYKHPAFCKLLQFVRLQRDALFCVVLVFDKYKDFLCPGLNDRGHIVFILSVCLSVVNYNIQYNF